MKENSFDFKTTPIVKRDLAHASSYESKVQNHLMKPIFAQHRRPTVCFVSAAATLSDLISPAGFCCYRQRLFMVVNARSLR